MVALSKVGTNAVRVLKRCKPIAKVCRVIVKKKPDILNVGGTLMIVGAFGWAIYEAVNLKDVLIETSDTVKAVEDSYETEIAEAPDDKKPEIEKEYKKDIRKARFKGVMKVGGKFVLPTMALAAGIIMKDKGFIEERSRKLVAIAAAKASQESFKFYRENVKKELGDDADKRYSHGIETKEIEKVTTDENGKEKKVKEKVSVQRKMPSNPWRFEFTSEWFGTCRDHEQTDLAYLKQAQDWWNNYEFENYGDCGISMYEILKWLRYNFDLLRDTLSPQDYRKRLKFMRENGWKKGSKGDGFIDFGIYREANAPVFAGRSDMVYLEFNCDGLLFE